jgi:hypothetical protein
MANSPTHQRPTMRRQAGVSAQLPGSPWGEGGLSTPNPQGDPPDERGWDLQLAVQTTTVHLARQRKPLC